MIWTYCIVLSLGVVLGWSISRLINRITTATASVGSTTPPSDPSQYTPISPSAELTAKPPTINDQPPTIHHPPSTPSPTNVSTPPLTSQSLQLAYEMAHHLGQYKAGFLARTSHELRSPLNRVMSLQQLILADLCDTPEEEREFTRQSYEAAQELLDLLDRTTAISKLRHGTADLNPESLSLIGVLSELELQTQLHAKNRNLRLAISAPESEVKVWADPRWLRQILINLVTTPIYLMEEGHITVSHEVDTAAKTVRIMVEDERPVSAWSESTTLLTPADPSSSEAPTNQKTDLLNAPSSSAWGLSLLTTTQLAELMQGTLDILSIPVAPEEGKTRIQFTIPLAA